MTFVNECEKSFGSLILKYNLKALILDSEEVIFKNKTTGLRVVYEKKESAIFVQIGRLVACEFPKYKSVHEYDNDLKNRFDINFLIKLRSSKSVASSLFNSSMRKTLDNYASAIDKYASDVLEGDFSVFPKLTKLVKANIEQLKQDGLL